MTFAGIIDGVIDVDGDKNNDNKCSCDRTEQILQKLNKIDNALVSLKLLKIASNLWNSFYKPPQTKKEMLQTHEFAKVIPLKSFTFPRMSQSRKVENLNINLPTRTLPAETYDTRDELSSFNSSALIPDDKFDITSEEDNTFVKKGVLPTNQAGEVSKESGVKGLIQKMKSLFTSKSVNQEQKLPRATSSGLMGLTKFIKNRSRGKIEKVNFSR